MGLKITDLCVEIQKTRILKHINLEIRDGEFISLLGASGCGKTTLLKCIAGLLEAESGEMEMDVHSMLDVPPEKRGTVIVFQDLRLFPHMTVEQNIGFTMELKKVPKVERAKRVAELLEAVQLPGFEKRKMREMSGGQKQRVALARALAADPKMLLLDEPFSSLDENLRCEMADLVRNLHKKLGLTVIMVTHDKEEAMKVSDYIALMQEGEILQYDHPETMFYHPVSPAVADYMGQTNYLRGRVSEGMFCCEALKMKAEAEDGDYQLMVRPSAIRLTREGGCAYVVKEILFEGERAEILLERGQEHLQVWMLHREWKALQVEENGEIGVVVDGDSGVLFSL